MKYTLIRQRRKTLSLSFDKNGDLLVKAPLKLGEEEIEKFVSSKARWIEKHKEKQGQVADFKAGFDFLNYIYIYGEKLNFQDVDMSLMFGQTAEKQRKIGEFYREEAHKALFSMAKDLSQKTGLKYKTLKLSNSRRNWGSYDREGNMKLNFRLIILPKPLIEYVILHELCHSKELNHSPAFCQLLSLHCPDYKDRKAKLGMYDFLLEI